jgi:hypothetical protein
MKSNREVWAVPVLLGLLTVVGLLVALLADGVWDLVSVAALAVPVLVGLWCALRPPRPPHG